LIRPQTSASQQRRPPERSSAPSLRQMETKNLRLFSPHRSLLELKGPDQ